MDVTCGVYSRAATIRSAAFIRGNTVYVILQNGHRFTALLIFLTDPHLLAGASSSLVYCLVHLTRAGYNNNSYI